MVERLIRVFQEEGGWAVYPERGPSMVFDRCAQAVSYARQLADAQSEDGSTVRVYFDRTPQEAT